MPKQSDNADLAKRYLDLWQEQTALMAADPRFAEAIGHVVGQLSPKSSAGDGPAEGKRGDGDTEPAREPDKGSGGKSAAEAGAAPDGPAPDLGDDVAGELARRIAECEARLAALASEAGGGRGKPDD